MARDAVTIVAGTMNAGNSDPTGTTITVANGAYLNAGSDLSGVVLILRNTAASAKNFTILAGDNPPAVTASTGNLTVQVPATSIRYVFLESMRFVQAVDTANSYPAGRIDIDFESGTTGTVAALRIPVAAR